MLIRVSIYIGNNKKIKEFNFMKIVNIQFPEINKNNTLAKNDIEILKNQ